MTPAPVSVEEERCPVCSYSLAAHRKLPPDRSQFVCGLYLDNAGTVPQANHFRPRQPGRRFFGMYEADEK